jgi:hypothetical protein
MRLDYFQEHFASPESESESESESNLPASKLILVELIGTSFS